jgi:type IX secretion system PorP/SprF family membrane protein
MTYRASYSQFFNRLKGGIGVQVIRDNQGSGAINKTYVSGIYSYRIVLQRNIHVAPAIEAKYARYSLDSRDLIFPGMFDRSTWSITGATPAEELLKSSGYLEFNTGAIFKYINEYLRTYRDMTFGISVHHLNKPTSLLDKEYQIERKLTIYYDIEMFLNSFGTYKYPTLFIPTILYVQQKGSGIFHYGFYIQYQNVIFGGFIRHDPLFQYIIPSFQMGVTLWNTTVSYSYDAGFLNYKRSSLLSGAHEVTLSLNLSITGGHGQ